MQKLQWQCAILCTGQTWIRIAQVLVQLLEAFRYHLAKHYWWHIVSKFFSSILSVQVTSTNRAPSACRFEWHQLRRSIDFPQITLGVGRTANDFYFLFFFISFAWIGVDRGRRWYRCFALPSIRRLCAAWPSYAAPSWKEILPGKRELLVQLPSRTLFLAFLVESFENSLQKDEWI